MGPREGTRRSCRVVGQGTQSVHEPSDLCHCDGNDAGTGLAIALISELDLGTMPATATLSTDFLRPAFPPLTCEAVVGRCGRTMGFLTVTFRDRNGNVAAKCHGSMPIDGEPRLLNGTAS
ncbi:PaaI family thioesterase [Streptomyces sp. NPDC001868]|uniref:PaaI family thioesterase n=1 Tax=Streptomyces sp. NPDC001868 TaxID=3154401 RepID=UPI00332272A4